jgi:hypothetical protein
MDALTNTVNHVKNELMPGVDFTQFDHIHEHHHEHHPEHHEEAAVEPKATTNDAELKWD